MAEESLAPSPNFVGIDFNPAFFPSGTSEFVEYPNAQGTVTFSKIFATEIDTPSPSIAFDFLTSQTADVNIATSVGASQTIKIGQATGTSVHAGSIDFKGTHINNNVSASTGDISLANNQTTGVLNIGTGSRTGAGAINIGTAATGLFNINVGTTNQSTTTVNNILVGSNGCIAGRTNYLSYNVSTSIPSTINLDLLVYFYGSTASQTLTLPLGVASQRMYIKNYATVDVTINGGVMVLWGLLTTSSTLLLKSGESVLLLYNIGGWTQATPTNAFGTLDAPKFDTNMTLGSNLTTGDLTIAGAQTTGDINIGNGSARLAGGAINIGAGTTAANPITIGGTSSVITLNAQPTIGYAVKVATATSSLAFIGGRYEVRIAIGSRTINTSRTAFCVMNNLPTGVYHITPYVYIPQGVATNVEVLLCTGTSPISEGNTTGLTPVGDGSETFTSASATIPNSVNSSWVYVVSSPVNIALGISSGIILSTSSAVYLKIIRIG